MSNAQTKPAMIRRISAQATPWPKQSRAPPPKCLDASRLSEAKGEDVEVVTAEWSQRSGMNAKG